MLKIDHVHALNKLKKKKKKKHHMQWEKFQTMTTDPVSSSSCGGWLWMLQAVLRSSYLGRDDESASSNRELLDCRVHCCTDDCDWTTVYGISRRCCSLIPEVSTSPNSKCLENQPLFHCFTSYCLSQGNSLILQKLSDINRYVQIAFYKLFKSFHSYQKWQD